MILKFFLDLLTYTLETEGYINISIAKDGKDGLKKAKISKYDLILTDLNMPKMDGIKLISKLRKLPQYKKIPILMISTEYNDEIKSKGKKAGANGWIVKPFIPNQLIKAVDICLSKY